MTSRNAEYVYSSGTYTYALASLSIARIDQSYVISYLVISSLIVLMAYAGFWISPSAAPAPVAFGVMCVGFSRSLGLRLACCCAADANAALT